MSSPRHKISAGILFIILYAPFIYSLGLQVEKQWHQHKEDISSVAHTMIHIEIPANDLQWERRDKEIILKGKYFDVKNCQIRNNIAYIIGHFDERESFFAYVLQQIQHNTNNKEKKSIALQQLQWFGVFTSIPLKTTFSITEFCFLKNKYFIQSSPFAQHPFVEIAGLPPWS